ncbi:hypothetical protein RJT34_26487 [Clitoria ternatea]|uniref:Uncharacterized protein n=1 Tax=Clitoria ternatea TaxID=43366 RepID=A0AAN9F8W5_CLITE
MNKQETLINVTVFFVLNFHAHVDVNGRKEKLGGKSFFGPSRSRKCQHHTWSHKPLKQGPQQEESFEVRVTSLCEEPKTLHTVNCIVIVCCGTQRYALLFINVSTKKVMNVHL